MNQQLNMCLCVFNYGLFSPVFFMQIVKNWETQLFIINASMRHCLDQVNPWAVGYQTNTGDGVGPDKAA